MWYIILAWLGVIAIRLALIFVGALIITNNVNEMLAYGRLEVWPVIWTALGVVLIGFKPSVSRTPDKP